MLCVLVNMSKLYRSLAGLLAALGSGNIKEETLRRDKRVRPSSVLTDCISWVLRVNLTHSV